VSVQHNCLRPLGLGHLDLRGEQQEQELENKTGVCL